jgi:hypothetical protein
VLKTTAKSPREYDASIPEPLADVVMKALHPSTDVRFKDGAEAEAALKRSWEECLAGEMVLLPSLTGPEMPHDRVGAAMHHTVPVRGRTGIARGGKGAVVAVSAPPPAPPPPPERLAMPPSRPPQPVGDDDPTRIMNRAPEIAEPVAPRVVEAAGRGGNESAAPDHGAKEWPRHSYHKTVEESHPFGQGRGLDGDRSRAGASAVSPAAPVPVPAARARSEHDPRRASAIGGTSARAPQPARQPVRRKPPAQSALPARIGLWIAILLLAVAAGAAGAYLLIGAI